MYIRFIHVYVLLVVESMLTNPMYNCYMHCKNKIVKITNLLVSTVARYSGNFNLIGRLGCYDYI